jgi:hypothetical protein
MSELVKDVLDENSILLATHIKQNRMTGGTTKDKLSVRSGKLRSSVKPKVGRIKGNTIQGGVTIGTAYAGVHVGEGETRITPKSSQYLTIPLKAAKTRSGVAKGRATDTNLWGNTFVRDSKAGNKIIFGQSKYVRGQSAGQAHGDIVPLFVLKKSVKVKARINPNELLKWIKKKIIRSLELGVKHYVK